MRRREFLQGTSVAVPLAAWAAEFPNAVAQAPAPAPAVEAAPLALPKPQIEGGRPLMQALSSRRTTRSMSEEKLSPQVLSNLLWAAWGVNRSAKNGRTAPSAMNVQEISLYVFLPEGVYLFDAGAHCLKLVLTGDHRAQTGTQAGVAKGPVSLVYVADLDKYNLGRGGRPISDAAQELAWSNAHCGFIAQNVYLFAASEGLASWFRASVDAKALAKLLNLGNAQKVLYSQGVGYPA